MRIICVDDEVLVLELTVSMCRELPMEPEAKGFTNAKDAMEYLENESADIAILDINMPDVDGLVLAAKIKEVQPDIAIIFLTGYSEYAVEAYAMHAQGYILKPINKERLATEIQYALSSRPEKEMEHIEVKTFGNTVDVLVDGQPILFGREKSRELLAYLIDRRGSVTRADIFAALWEEGFYDRAMQKQLDVIIRNLRKTLKEYNISEILEMERGILRVVPDKFNCDLYRFMDGDIDTVHAFRGEYLSDYPWASITEAYMDRINNE